MNSKVKVVIAVICLAAAGIMIAVNMGVFSGGKAGPAAGSQNTNQPGSNADGTTPKEEEAQTAGQLKKDNF